MSVKIDQERLEQMPDLLHGTHPENDGAEMCAMEAVAWVTHERWSDRPACVCPAIGRLIRSWNDTLDDKDRTRLLRGLIPTIINTRGNAELERRRRSMALDWLVRVHTPAWLRLAGIEYHASILESHPEITYYEYGSDLLAKIQAAESAAESAAWAAAGSAAWAAARDAAGNAAESAAGSAAGTAAGSAAGSAAGTAAWDAAWDAARDAAWDAAWDAARDAARDAAWDAAWDAARDALLPTVTKLQNSAVLLIKRMSAEVESQNVG